MHKILLDLCQLSALALIVASRLTGYASPTGVVDPTFGAGGILRVSAVNLTDAVLQTDGKLLVRGLRLGQATISRYNRDGSVDIGFGSGGVSEPSSTGLRCTALAASWFWQTGESPRQVGQFNRVGLTTVPSLWWSGFSPTARWIRHSGPAALRTRA
jgi:hypothetical protein